MFIAIIIVFKLEKVTKIDKIILSIVHTINNYLKAL